MPASVRGGYSSNDTLGPAVASTRRAATPGGVLAVVMGSAPRGSSAVRGGGRDVVGHTIATAGPRGGRTHAVPHRRLP